MDGATVGAGAIVRDAVISAGASVGADAVVEGSIVGPRASIGPGAKLSDLAMVGADEVVAPGTVLVGAAATEHG